MDGSSINSIPLCIRKRAVRVSLTPLIDCVFILLIFFMIQTDFLGARAVEIEAAASGVSGVESKQVVVELHDDGSVWFDGGQSSLEALLNYASEIGTPNNITLILLVDDGVVLQKAVDVIDLFNQFGVLNITMSAGRKFN